MQMKAVWLTLVVSLMVLPGASAWSADASVDVNAAPNSTVDVTKQPEESMTAGSGESKAAGSKPAEDDHATTATVTGESAGSVTRAIDEAQTSASSEARPNTIGDTSASGDTNSTSDALVNAIYADNVVDRRIPLTVSIAPEKYEATVSMFVSRDSSSFDTDSKIAALKIAKSILDAQPSLTLARVQFKSLRCDDYKEIIVGGGDVSSYNAGRKSKEDVANGLEIVSIPISNEQLQSQSTAASALLARLTKAKEGAGFDTGTPRTEPSNGSPLENPTASATPTPENGRTGDNAITAVVPVLKPTAFSGTGPRTTSASPSASVPAAHGANDKLFIWNSIAFYYPPHWAQRRVSKNAWATPDEDDVAEIACQTRTGQPLVSLARFFRISASERLRTESDLGTAFNLEVTQPEPVRFGSAKQFLGQSLLSTGRDGQIYFRRIYFQMGRELYALTLRCKDSESSTCEREFSRMLATVHTPVKKK
jgi:hypothetical protein